MKRLTRILQIALPLTLAMFLTVPAVHADEAQITYALETFEEIAGENGVVFPADYAGTVFEARSKGLTSAPSAGVSGSSAVTLEGNIGSGEVRLATTPVPLNTRNMAISLDFKVLQMPDKPELVRETGGVYGNLTGSSRPRKQINLFTMADGGSASGNISYDDTSGKLAVTGGTNKLVLTEGKWYKLVFYVESRKIDTTTKLPAQGYYRYLKVYDETGELFSYRSNLDIKYCENGTEYNKKHFGVDGFAIYPVAIPALVEWVSGGVTYTPTRHIKLALDNVETFLYDPYASYNADGTPNVRTTPQLLTSSIANGATDVRRNPEMSFTFDRNVTGRPTLFNSQGVEVSIPSTAVSTLYNKVTISLAGTSLLNRNETYTLKFGGISDANSGLCTHTDSVFTTEELHMLNDVDILSVSPGAQNTAVTFKIDEPYDYSTFALKMVAAVYKDGCMVALDVQPVTMSDDAPQTVNFALGNLTGQTGYELRVMACDADLAGNVVPVASGTVTVS